jgi:Pyruvate/2-oxoacid:ferredoxin oxidoreductase delta subunit
MTLRNVESFYAKSGTNYKKGPPMSRKRLVLTFPSALVHQPITYYLIKDYDLMINILRASVTPNETGRLVIELSGNRNNLDRGIKYLKGMGVQIEPLAQDVKWRKNKCTHCTVCIPVCPTDALKLNRGTMAVSFDSKKCIACGLCIDVCPYRAVEIMF